MDDAQNTRSALVNVLINQFILKNGIDPMDYTFDSFFDWYVNENNIEVIHQDLPMNEEFLLGVTVKSQYSTAMFINKTLTWSRSNFSKCHELNHCIFDLNPESNSQQLFNVEDNPSFYTPEEWKQEQLANLGASIVMMPDITVLRYLHTMKSFPLIAEENHMSKSAFWKRLVQFGIERCGFQEGTAIKAATRLQDEGNREIYHKFLYTWGSTKGRQIELDFENSI